MKTTLEFDHDETEEAKCAIRAWEIQGVVDEAVEFIRQRLKYGEGISDDEANTLERIRAILLDCAL